MSLERPPFPEVIDDSMMQDFRACPQRCFKRYFEFWNPKGRDVNLHAGGVFAHGLEVARRSFFEQGESEEIATVRGVTALLSAYGDFECPADSPKSAERMAGALEFYLSSYPLSTDPAQPYRRPSGKYAIEFNGVEPLELTHPVTGMPLLYSWRFDQVTLYRETLLLGQDEKTTTRLGDSWMKKWNLRSQFMGYTWGAAQHGLELKGFLVRGIAILKKSFELAEVIAYFPPWQIDRWYKQLHRDIARMIRCWEEGYWDYNLDESCNAYNRGCVFRSVCQMAEPQALLDTLFEKRKWNPVTREETLL